MKQELNLPGQTYLVCLKNVRCGEGFYDAACYDFYLKRLCHSLDQFQVNLPAANARHSSWTGSPFRFA